jgi:hypothetical protein
MPGSLEIQNVVVIEIILEDKLCLVTYDDHMATMVGHQHPLVAEVATIQSHTA